MASRRMAGASPETEGVEGGSASIRPEVLAGLPCSSEGVAWPFDEFGKELPVSDHPTTEIFSRRLAPIVTYRDVMAASKVLDHARIIDGNIGDPLIPVRHRVPTQRHHLSDQRLCISQRAFGIVDESRLNGTPGRAETSRLVRRQRPDVQ